MPFPDDLTDLHHRTAGDGPRTVLTLHGGMGLDHTTLAPHLDPLGEHATLVYWDQRGNGRSARPPAHELTLDRWADDTAAIADLLHLHRPFLLAHSFAAAIAVTATLRHPHRFAGLILCTPQLANDHLDHATTSLAARATPATHAALATWMAHTAPTDDDLATFWRTIQPLYFRRPERADAIAFGQHIRFSADAITRSGHHIAPTLDLTPHLARLDLPVLLLAGRHDWLFPVEHTITRPLRHLRRGQGHIFEDSGHFPFIEEPETFTDVVAAWLAHTDPR